MRRGPRRVLGGRSPKQCVQQVLRGCSVKCMAAGNPSRVRKAGVDSSAFVAVVGCCTFLERKPEEKVTVRVIDELFLLLLRCRAAGPWASLPSPLSPPRLCLHILPLPLSAVLSSIHFPCLTGLVSYSYTSSFSTCVICRL